MEIYLCADLYEAAFLLTQGASFKRVKEYFKNHIGKSFSILELEGVTFEMLELLHNPNALVNYLKFKNNRKKVKQKIEKYAQTIKHKEITSQETYKIHKELEKQYTKMKEFYKGTGPKRVIQENEETTNTTTN